MSKRVLRSFTSEFKEQAVSLAVNGEKSIAQTARDLGISSGTLYSWIALYRQEKLISKQPKGKTTLVSPSDAKVRELEAQIRRLTTERDILKKAIAYCMEVPK